MGRTGWRRSRLPGGLAWLYIGRNRRNKESLRHSAFLSTHLSASAFSFPLFSQHIWTRSVPFSHFQQSVFPSCPCSMSTGLSSFSSIVLYLSSARSFHFCLFVCVLTILSLLHLFTGKELGIRSVPVQSRLCYPTKRVGVKHRQWHSVPGRWHHTEANGCRQS